MENSSASLPNTPNDVYYPAEYSSMMLQMYLENLKRSRGIQVLDMGPVCEENITFFAQQVKRHYVCDMFIRLDRNRRKKLKSADLWNHLDYAQQSFDGIHLWDLVDHLNDAEASKLMELCHFMLRPMGMIMAYTFDEHSIPSFIYSFVIRDSDRITFRPQHHLDLPWHYRTNRELILLLTTFRLIKSFLYRNGIREFLFQRV